ncbi:GNAT family N-acetyltransferase [Nocardia sp. BMG51109]|uniref:GNAT family N-acetyltransferase n=1 Tax=Nocardia sp. BMG51109 TaxID=1056816 RepID=UPI0004657A37|nr:GNAT family protein [Nocardia sp. BMG51109]
MTTPHDRARPPDLRALPRLGNALAVLRPWTDDDLPAIAEAAADPYIPLITTVPARYTPEQGATWLQRQSDQAAGGRGCPLAIVSVTSAEVVGMATINAIDWTHRRGNIGYWVLDRHRGNGYAEAAVTLLIDLAAELGLLRLQALVEPGNHASQAVCHACGFVPEGVLRGYQRIGDTHRDMIMFGLVLRPRPE